MMLTSPRLNLPLLAVGQAQKEITHNESLLALDYLVHATCMGGPADEAPDEPMSGTSYLVGSSPSGEWERHANAVATFTSSGWRFTPALEGMALRSVPEGHSWQYLGGAWVDGVTICKEVQVAGRRVLGPQAGAIVSPTGGSIVDVEARKTIVDIIEALQQHGLIASD